MDGSGGDRNSRRGGDSGTGHGDGSDVGSCSCYNGGYRNVSNELRCGDNTTGGAGRDRGAGSVRDSCRCGGGDCGCGGGRKSSSGGGGEKPPL